MLIQETLFRALS